MNIINPHAEPFRAIFEGLNDLATSIYARTGKKGLLRVKIAHEIGLALGLLPGQVGQVATVVGYVEIESDAPPCAPASVCPICFKDIDGGHERDGSNLCWGHDDEDEG